jgi:hypothetical protein
MSKEKQIFIESLLIQALALAASFILLDGWIDRVGFGWAFAIVWSLLTFPVSVWTAVRAFLSSVDVATFFSTAVGLAAAGEASVGIIVGLWALDLVNGWTIAGLIPVLCGSVLLSLLVVPPATSFLLWTVLRTGK